MSTLVPRFANQSDTSTTHLSKEKNRNGAIPLLLLLLLVVAAVVVAVAVVVVVVVAAAATAAAAVVVDVYSSRATHEPRVVVHVWICPPSCRDS